MRSQGWSKAVRFWGATAGSVLVAACGGHARNNVAAGGAAGAPTTAEGGSPGTAGTVDSGGLAGAPPTPVDPEISRAWSWQECGRLELQAPDRDALFDGSGRIVVLGSSQVRVHDAAGALEPGPSGGTADFLVVDPDGAVLSGQTTATGISLTPVGESTPRVVLPRAPAGNCGQHYALSADGEYLVASDTSAACAWRLEDASFVGRADGEQGTVLDAAFVTVERGASSIDVVRRDFAGREVSRRSFGESSVALSPAGDRVIADGELFDVETGEAVPWDVRPGAVLGPPVFSPRGEMVLLGNGVYETAAGARRFAVPPAGRLATTFGTWRVLAPDGRHVLASAEGRATLFDVESLGVAAVLGPPPFPESGPDRGTSDLAISGDGSLLVHSIESFSTFSIRVAPSFGDSQVIWSARVELNLGADVSRDGKFVAVGGDGRAIYDGGDGHAIWPSDPPPPAVAVDICLLDRLQFSPQASWIASSSYSGELEVFRFGDRPSAQAWPSARVLPGECDAATFSRDGRLVATSTPALYETSATQGDWKRVWASTLSPQPPEKLGYPSKDARFSPDDSQLLVSRCWTKARCVNDLLSVATGAVVKSLPELMGPHPSFSPDGSWLIAADKLMHLATGEVRSLSPDADPESPALFTPEGDIIAGSHNGTLTRYCRRD